MAIIEELGIQVRVMCGDTPCPEYEDTEEDGDRDLDELPADTPSCRRFIESRVDVEFGIEVSALPGGPASKWLDAEKNIISFSLSFDGSLSNSCPAIDSLRRSNTRWGVPNHRDQTQRKYRFASISTVESADKDRLAEDNKKAKKMGLIQVGVMRAVEKPSKPLGHEYSSCEVLKDRDLSLAEKALKGKAVSLGVTTAGTSVAMKASLLSVDFIDTRKEPFAVFYLKYRSRDDLQKMMIIPRPPPDDEDDGFANLSREQIERLARERYAEEIGRKRSRSVTVKAEDRKNIPPPPPKRPYKYTRTSEGKKAIDLTEDGDDD